MRLRPNAVLLLLEWSIVAMSVGFLALHTLPRAWKTLNTDFPNYYLAAQLARDGVDISRAYEWRWLQRQKDHAQIDQRVVGLVPITPFSTLFVWPLSHLPPLTAKHIWLSFNLSLLIPIAWALCSMTKQPLRRITLFMATCLPLHRNLIFGQYYILLLALLVFACWAYTKKRFVSAGVLIAIAAATKIFPVLFIVYFLRKRNWTALLATGLALACISLLSVSVFGWAMHRTYLNTVLPWTLHGEALPPYVLTSSSISTVLHRLFIFEPDWNPRPWLNRPVLSAALQPLLQMIILAPAILLAKPGNTGLRRTCVEWSALIAATLAISTVPASYNFTLMIFPVAALCGVLRRHRPWTTVMVAVLYLAIGYPGWNTASVDGLYVLLHVPRLYCLILFTIIAYKMLGVARARRQLAQRSTVIWLSVFIAITGLSVYSNLMRVRNIESDYAYRLNRIPNLLMSASPVPTGGTVASISLVPDGYHLAPSYASVAFPPRAAITIDQLSFAWDKEGVWVEESGNISRLVSDKSSSDNSSLASIQDAHSPVLGPDQLWIGYLRSYHGRDRLFKRSILAHPFTPEFVITPASLNVEEATLLPDNAAIVSGLSASGISHLYRLKDDSAVQLSGLGESRYPAISPDGKWLAYSRFKSGVWNLWLANIQSNATRRIAEVPCNQIEPSWESDSKTIVYASDCGRALWFTAICRRKVVNP